MFLTKKKKKRALQFGAKINGNARLKDSNVLCLEITHVIGSLIVSTISANIEIKNQM